MSDFRDVLRAELVAAAERPLPRVRRLPERPVLLRAGGFALAAVAVLLAIVVLPWGADRGVQPALHGADLPGTPLFGGSLDPGVRYRTRALVPQISFRANSDRWFVQEATSPSLLVLQRREGNLGAAGGEKPPLRFLSFLRIATVTDPGTGAALPAPRDLVGWLRSNRDLGVTSVSRTTLAGRPATRLAFHIPLHPERFDPQCEFVKVTVDTVPPQIATCAEIAANVSLPVNAAGTLIVPDGRNPLIAEQLALVPSQVGQIERESAPLLAGLLIAG